MNKKIYFISGNEGKILEFKNIIPEVVSKDIKLKEIQSLDAREVIKDKLQNAYEIFKKEKIKFDGILVEDTSLYIKALNNFPGPLIKFFLGAIKNEGVCKIVHKIKNSDEASVKCYIGYMDKDKNISFYMGEVKGKISKSPKGNFGFGWDSIFIPDCEKKTFGEMTLEEKNKYSMRKKAICKLKKYLKEN